ncbi:RmlC-like cupin [Pseudovirgaria hyperparasitica]|uniref:RmlC-like cupin n=1 Tax=Pseudovirgaria hyperparasitica TaxID=470096 RepID=A0A6A6VY56_9PEZI|nr:RmlC-like cupin [Pseudovirgaria hyperparasitica]KAF2754217.1 RmlC-like cupin [Pseudovirgaria hyperparasitica]
MAQALFSIIALAAVSAAAAVQSPVDAHDILERAVNPKTVNTLSAAQLQAQRQGLILAGSEQNRLNLLFPNAPDATNNTYQFINNTVKAPTGGTVFLGTVESFPALYSTDVSIGIGFVNPCGLNTPHIHPRANEFLVVTQGTLIAGLELEQDNGYGNVVGGEPNVLGPIPQVNATLTNYTGFLFPKGLTHWQFNPNCEPAVFVAAFDSSDPGRAEVARSFFSVYPSEVDLSATGYQTNYLSSADVDQLRATANNQAVSVVQSCAKRCGIPFQKRDLHEFLFV